MSIPAIHGEFVFNGTRWQRKGHFPNRIVVGIGQGIAATAPSVEGTVHVHRRKGCTGITTHIHFEGDRVGRGSTGHAAVPTNNAHRTGRCDVVNPVGKGTRCLGTSGTGCQILLTIPAIHGEFVFNRTGQEWQCDFVNGIVVGVGHGIARTAPAVK